MLVEGSVNPNFMFSFRRIRVSKEIPCFIGGVSYEEMNFALLIPMPEVNKKHTRMTKHRDLK